MRSKNERGRKSQTETAKSKRKEQQRWTRETEGLINRERQHRSAKKERKKGKRDKEPRKNEREGQEQELGAKKRNEVQEAGVRGDRKRDGRKSKRQE